MRHSLIIAIAVIVVIALGGGVYVYLHHGASGLSLSPSGATTLPPAGSTTSVSPPSGSGSATSTATVAPPAQSAAARLVQITPGPVVPGEAVIDATTATGTAVTVLYIEQQSGNVFSYAEASGTITRTSNKTLPSIQDAQWTPDGVSAFVQYLSGDDFSTVNTYELPADDASSGTFLDQDLAGLAVSASGILTLASNESGSTATLARLDGTHAAQAFSTPLSSLRVSFAGKNQYLAFTKPAAALDGDAFLVDSAGRFSRIAGPLPGLAALASPSGAWLLVSSTAPDGSMRLDLVDGKTGADTLLPVGTIADKCVWAADDSAAYCGVPENPPTGASYPDDWYQGAVHFSDQIWKINPVGRYAQLVLDPSQETGTAVDVEAPAIDAAQTTLVFINRNDGSLWSYSL